MKDLPEVLEQLSHRLDELETRVEALEHPHEATITAPLPLPLAPVAEDNAIEQAGGAFPIIGKAMLGIAGAYVLRAVEASATVPGPAMAVVAIAYAMGWLVWAARSESRSRLAATIYAGTSALILAPMLWELLLRFAVVSPALAAAVLFVYAAAASSLAWKHARSPVYWIAHGAAAATGITLGISANALEPFLAELLGLVLISEYGAARRHERSVRPLVSMAAAAGVWVLIFVYSGPVNTRAGYPVLSLAEMLAPGCTLFAINAVGITARTTWLRRPITILDTVQAMIAFLLAAASVLYFAPHSGEIVLGVVCLLVSAACYAASFAIFRREAESRNYMILAVWSAGLLMLGTTWSMPSSWMSLCLGLASIVATALGAKLNSKMLELQGVVYLAVAASASGLIWHAGRMLAGALPGTPTWNICAVAACALVDYAFAKERNGEDWRLQTLHFALAFLAMFALAAFLAQGFLWLTARWVVPDVFQVALVRTLAICVLALALASGGCRLQRVEMTRIAYAALAFLAVKLLFEDLRHGRMEFIAASLFLFAVTLIGVPRLGHKNAG